MELCSLRCVSRTDLWKGEVEGLAEGVLAGTQSQPRLRPTPRGSGCVLGQGKGMPSPVTSRGIQAILLSHSLEAGIL